jgi:hypothetical protein
VVRLQSGASGETGPSQKKDRSDGSARVVYLIIMVLVAGIGIGTLYWQQRSQRAHLDSVEGFRASLQKIAPEAAPGPFRRAQVASRPRPGARRRTPGRPVPLDERQRAAARRRLEARRRDQTARVAGSRNGI